MKRLTAATAMIMLGLSLTGCAVPFWDYDPFEVFGRDEGGKPLDYATLMRIGAGTHAAGNLPAAVVVYREAAILDPGASAPLAAAGNTLLEMGEPNEAITAYDSALSRSAGDGDALRGLARAYLMTGEAERAGTPLAAAYHETPDDPKLLQLIGVADDFAGQHEEAQARYRRGLELLPQDRALSLNLALSLALTGNFPEAIGVLRPLAAGPGSTPRERLTLALIYGLAGDRPAAEAMARRDLDHEEIQRNLNYYDDVRHLPPDARMRAIQTLSRRTDQPHS